MELLREFGSCDLFGDKYPRRMLASRQALNLLKRLAVDKVEFLDDIQKIMEKYDFHTCFISRTYDIIAVYFVRHRK